MPDRSTLSRPVPSWDWPKILLYIPVVQNMGHMADIFYDFLAIASTGVALLKQPPARTDVARNKAVEAFLATEFTHLLMLDTDQRHSHLIIHELAQWVIDDPDRLIVGGLYYRRGEPFDPLMFIKRDGEYYIPEEWPLGLLEVDVIGTGCILIAREVFERLPEPWFQYDYSTPGLYPSEDVYFCKKAREAGIRIFCDTRVDSPHAITNYVTEDTYRTYLEAHSVKAQDAIQESLSAKIRG